MNATEFAALIDGSRYPFTLSPEQRSAAKAAGLVVVYGASDDLIEFRGAIHDEAGAPGLVLVDRDGILPIWVNVSDDEDDAREYFRRKAHAASIEAIWCPDGHEPPVSFAYNTTIPHATFRVVEDDEVYCIGIVFSINDLAGGRTMTLADALALADHDSPMPHLAGEALRVLRATLVNPHTGEPRDWRDVNSDPAGVLCVKPGAPLLAAQQQGHPPGTSPIDETVRALPEKWRRVAHLNEPVVAYVMRDLANELEAALAKAQQPEATADAHVRTEAGS